MKVTNVVFACACENWESTIILFVLFLKKKILNAFKLIKPVSCLYMIQN